MRIDTVTGSIPTKRVRIDGIAADRPVSDDLLAGFAMKGAGEDPSSLYGWHVSRSEDGKAALVSLYTD
jgi:hypothetical protein